jgi:UDP-2-acetamido-2,6-beta-L-arabino-hexul-4-ose reductase
VRVLVTGADGFIGKNLLVHLARLPEVEVMPIVRDSTPADLLAAASRADHVFHLAGVNRPKDQAEFVAGNVDFTQALVDALRTTGQPIPVSFASSIQAESDNPYGRSKRGGEDVLHRYQAASGGRVALYRLPNVFGKWCRPDYNSAVATFCHNIARGLPIVVHDPSAALSLVYIDDVIGSFIEGLDDKQPGVVFPQVKPVYATTVGEVAAMIRAFRKGRDSLIVEAVGTGLTRALYSTYVSYLPPSEFSYTVPRYGDARGDFVEMLKTRDSGQMSYFTSHPGVTRGGHYHHSKTEKFLVLKGRARFGFRHIGTNERFEIQTSGDVPCIVETVPGWSHDITNVGDEEMIVMLWANEIFDRDRPDTYAHPV